MFTKKKRNSLKALFIAFLLTVVSCNNLNEPLSLNDESELHAIRNSVSGSSSLICGDPLEVTLLAGQHIDMGTLMISNRDDGTLHITALLNDQWFAVESHMHITPDPADFPMTPKGNPKIGNFEYKEEYNPGVQSISYSFSLTDLNLNEGDIVYIAFHLSVERIVDGEIVQSETAWSHGIDFPGRSWAMYVMYEVQECEEFPEEEAGQLRTQTQGGWGSVARGNNPGAYRDENFFGAFPDGLMIGLPHGDHVYFSSSMAIMDFLPQGGTPSALQGVYTDPLSTSAGVLAGQVTALTLSVGFDLFDDSFGPSSHNLKDLAVIDPASPFTGMTVEDILSLANEFLAFGTGPFSASEINEVISNINENYVDGIIDNGFLGL